MANPMLYLGGIVVGAALAAVGVVTVPGWVAAAQDSNAKGDLANIREVQTNAFDINGQYVDDLAEVKDDAWGMDFKMSQGVKLVSLEASAQDWCAVVRSSSGKYFVANDKSAKLHQASTESAARALCASEDVIGNPTLNLDETGFGYDVEVTDARCANAPIQYRFRTASGAEGTRNSWTPWGDWGSSATFSTPVAVTGYTYSFSAEVRCGPDGTPVSPPVLTVQKGVDAPEQTVVTLLNFSGVITASSTVARCVDEATPQYQFRHRSTDPASNGVWSEYSAWATNLTFTVSPSAVPAATYYAQVNARCVEGGNVSAPVSSAQVSLTAPLAKPLSPALTLRVESGRVVGTGSAVCASGTTTRYSFRERVNATGTPGDFSEYGDHSASPNFASKNELFAGRIYIVEMRVLCTNGEMDSPPVYTEKRHTAVIGMPAAPTVLTTLNGSTITATSSVPACPAGTTAEYAWRERFSYTSTLASWPGVGDYGTSRSYVRTSALPGARYEFQVYTRCITPVMNSVAANAYATHDVPISAPPAPTLTNDGAGDGSVTNWVGVMSCPTRTTVNAEYRAWRDNNASGGGAWGAWTAMTGNSVNYSTWEQGHQYQLQMRYKCQTHWVASSLSATSASSSYTRPVSAPTPMTFSENITSAGYEMWISGGVCTGGTSVQQRWADYAYYTNNTVHGLNDAQLWGESDSHATRKAQWEANTAPNWSASFWTKYPGSWGVAYAGAAANHGGLHRGFTIRDSKMYVMRRCINTTTNRSAESPNTWSPLFRPNIKIN